MLRSADSATENQILIPTNMLQCELCPKDLKNKGHDGVMRATQSGQMKLYDRERHTYEWDIDPYCDVLWMFEWETIPIPIQYYVVARASSTMAIRAVGDSGQYAMLKEIEDYTKQQAHEYDNNQGEFSMLTGDPNNFYYLPYEVARTLQRY